MSGITRGQRVGRYELVEPLGEGGMGTVWLAHPDDDPGQLYAVKMVSAEYATDPRVTGMFVKEATLAAALDHPNIARLHDVGIHDDSPFFVMEWVDGWSLRDVARAIIESGERMPPEIALRIASDLCAGLHAAHELVGEGGTPLDLVHRDVSPHNVLVTREGIAKLIDFGVAKARDAATGAEASIVGGLKGKVRYMAPEQALEKEIDRRADLFSVGAVIYQLLTGRVPFEGPNDTAVLNALLSTAPVFVPEDLPEPVQWILRRALARRPEQRFADAAEMQDAIEHALSDLEDPVTHADVASCLGWFVPLDGALAAAHEPHAAHGFDPGHLPLEPEPALAYAAPALAYAAPDPAYAAPLEPALAYAAPLDYPAPLGLGANALPPPVRQPSLILGEDPLAPRAAFAGRKEGSLRFVLLGAAFVGLLGVGAALLVHEGPRRGARAAAPEIESAQLAPQPPPSVTTTTTSAPVTALTAPPTPVIDLGDLEGKPAASSRPRPKRPALVPPKNPYDLAGPVKVWK